MTVVKTRLKVAPDGTLSGRATGLPPGEHDVEITVPDSKRAAMRYDRDTLLSHIREIQAEVAQLPVLDDRSPDDIIGYNEHGHLSR